MKKVIGAVALLMIVALCCSTSNNNPAAPEEIWWGSPDNDAEWFEIENYCSYRMPPTKEVADSFCNEQGFSFSCGYTDGSCYVGGEQETVMSRVACSLF